MKKKIILILILVLVPLACFADEYILIMSKDDNVCQHMLNLYNSDLKKYGEVRYEKHKEFNWIKWEDKTFKLQQVGGLSQQPEIKNAQVAVFDINNDSKNEVIVYIKSILPDHPMDAYDVFRYDDFEMLNHSEIWNNAQYLKTKLKNFNSWQSNYIDTHYINETGIKKLPKRLGFHIYELKKSGNKNLNFISWTKSINFVQINNHFLISFEGPNINYNPDGPHENFGEYSIISELQRDNSLNNQCLYRINRNNSTKGRTK